MRQSIYCIGQRIKERRKEKSWTQKELAQRIGTSYKYISHVESGVKFPSLEMLICLARELEVSLDYLIGSDFLRNNPSSTAVVQQILNDCTPKEKAFLIDTMNYIKNRIKQS